MNTGMIRYLTSKLLIIEGLQLFVPLIVAFIYHESSHIIFSILLTILCLFSIGFLGIAFKPKNYHIYTKEGMIIVALCWILWSFFGALPFVFSGQIPSLIDAFFEMSSGFTTTGATILPDVSVLSHSLLFWRSFAHLIGGMGVLVFALAIMDNSKNNHLEVMKAEVPGPVFGKVVSKLKDTARILYLIYLIMFAIFALILCLAGMPVYDSLVISMGGAGTGGFAVYNDSIAHYHSDLIANIISVGTLMFGINFNLYYFILLRKFKLFFKDQELITYLSIVFVSTLLIWLNTGGLYQTVSQGIEYAFFEVATVITTTGFGITDITSWPLFSQFILLLLMFIGGCAGSTAGGIKVMRVLVLGKISKNQIETSSQPNRITSLSLNGETLDKQTQHSILKYFAVYSAILIALTLILSLDNNNFMIVASAAASTFNNIGPLLGTTDTFAIFSPFSKLIMAFAMIAGRLEIYPLLFLFLPKTWSKF